MSNTVVMKFGGTSVGSSDRIAAVAARVSAHIKKTGDRVVLVVSAMGGETDRLIKLSKQVSGDSEISEREYSQLVVAGEQVSTALVAMALQKVGVSAISMLAYQLPLKTKRVFGLNLIDSIETERLLEVLANESVPVVAGFQGIGDDSSYTTLGRGGSDTTAVAIAAALGSCRCFIFTDVDGVYSALPSLCKRAKKLKQVSYEEMLELAGGGAKVLQTRSVGLALKYRVPLVVCSSFDESEGTEIVEEYHGMEDAVVSGITSRSDLAKITLVNVPDKPGSAARIFRVIAEAGVVVDEIVHSQVAGEKATLAFTVPDNSAETVRKQMKDLFSRELKGTEIADINRDIAKVSIVGEGMRLHAGVAAQMFEVLAKEEINVEMVTTSEIKVSVLVDEKYAEVAVRALHGFFVENKP